MSATEIIKELARLTAAERRLVLNKLRELGAQDGEVRPGQPAAADQAASTGRLEEQSTGYRVVDLRGRDIGEAQAADLRARLKTFAEDWDRPEASIYDQDPAR